MWDTIALHMPGKRTLKTVPMAADYFNDIERGEGFLDPSSKELRGIHQTLRADPLRVVIADEDRLFVEGVSSLLDGWDEFKLVGKAYTLEDAFSLVIRLNPPVILMGAAMNGVPCAETVSKICEKSPQTRVMILASAGESGLVLDALRSGARGFGSSCIQGDEHGARIVGCVVNTILDGEGRVDFAKMRPIVYDSTRRIYRVVGEEVGGAWDAGKALM